MREVFVTKMMADVHVSLDSGDIPVTPCVLWAVRVMFVTPMMANVRVSLDSGDIPVTPCVLWAVREMFVTPMMADVRVSLDSGDITVTPCVLWTVREIFVKKMMADVHVSLDSGDITVTSYVLSAVREIFVTQMTAGVRADQAFMEISAPNNAYHYVSNVLTLKYVRSVRRVTTVPNATRNVDRRVRIRHVTLHLESVIRVKMDISDCFVTFHAAKPATTVNVADMAGARPDVHTTTTAHSASLNVLIIARSTR